MVHAVLSGPLHGPELRGALEALVTKGTHLVCWSTEITLSVAVAIVVVAIATTRVATVASIAATILGLTATKGTLRPAAKPSIAVPVPVAATTKITPPTPRIPIPAVILVATSSPPSTTSSVLCHLDQLGVNGLVGLAEHRDQVTGLFHVVGGEEGVSRARFLTSGCASNAVDIILGGVRVVIIDDKFDILHICESVAVWQNKTWRPHRILHTTTARSKGKVSNCDGWGKEKWSLGCGGNALKQHEIVYTFTPWEYYCGKRETMHTPIAYHNQKDPKDVNLPFVTKGVQMDLGLTRKEYAFTSPFPMQRNPPQIVK